MEIKKINDNFLQFHFRIYNEEFEDYLKCAFDNIKDKIEIKGFRKGFVPRDVFKKKIGDKKLYSDAFDILLKSKIQKILENQNNFSILDNPKLISCEIENLDKNDFFDFSLEFPLKPSIVLCDYKKIFISNISKENVTSEEIDNEISVFLQKNNFYLSKLYLSKSNNLPLEESDLAILDLKILYNEEKKDENNEIKNISLEIGKNQFLPGFDEGIKGMKINENRNFSLLIPNDFFDKNDNNKNISKKIFFDVLLKDIKIRDKNFYLNDDFVKSLKIDNISTLKDLKEFIKKKLENEKENLFQQNQKEEVLDFLIKNSVVELNNNFIIDEINYLKKIFLQKLKQSNLDLDKYLSMYQISKKDFEDKIKQQALKNLKTYFILKEIAEKENIKISTEELEKSYEKINLDYNISFEKIKENDFLQKKVQEDLLINKTISFLLKNFIC
ncbi:MAG: trigger factor [Candidatus Phytoplasma cynodontis]|nr:MAG: trigger factor [Candidatus Phytoplasma cynodontis]